MTSHGVPHLRFRCAYVAKELTRHGFKSDADGLLPQVAKETAYALSIPMHEQRQPSYGCLVVRDLKPFRRVLLDNPEYGGRILTGKTDIRPLADGCTSFVLSTPSKKSLWIANTPCLDSSDAYSLRDFALFAQSEGHHATPNLPRGSPDLAVVRRATDGEIAVLHWAGMTVYRTGNWGFRHYPYHYRAEEAMGLRGAATKDLRKMIRWMLRLCVQVLSPARIGATFVLRPEGDPAALNARLSFKNAIGVPNELSVVPEHHSVIAHILTQRDGAVLVKRDGRIESLGVWLVPKTSTIQATKSERGSRHLTAQALSRDTQTLVITVSSDGPVSVFLRGSLI